MGNLFCCVHLRMDSESISLMQDASAGWLCIRYGSCCESLTPNAGVLGVYNIAELLQTHAKKDIGSNTEDIARICMPQFPDAIFETRTVS